MSETLSMHLNLLETLLVAMQTIFRPYFHDPVEFDRIGSLFEFWCAQSKFQSERSALRSGSPAIKNLTLNQFLDGNEWRKLVPI